MQSGNYLSHIGRQGERVYYLEKWNQTGSALKTPWTVGDTHLIQTVELSESLHIGQ